MIIRFARLATIASPKGLVARGFLGLAGCPGRGSKQSSWRRRSPFENRRSANTRSRTSKTVGASHYLGVNDKNLDALSEATETLRQQWIAGRGSAWRPIESIQRVAAHRARHKSALVLAVRWLKIGVGVMAGVWIVLILLKALPPLELRLPIALGLAVVIAITGGVVESIRGRSLPGQPAGTPDGVAQPNQPNPSSR